MTLIVCAMESEAREIKNEIKDLNIKELLPQRYYYVGTLNKKKVALVVTGVGKTNAAAMTALVLNKENINLIINIGYAGAVKPYKLGDYVVIKDASYHDVDVTSISNLYEYGQVPGMPHPFLTDVELVKKARFNLKAGVESLYTGDKFVTEKVIDGVGIYDMEGAAVYQIANIFNKKIISIKLVSDILDSESQKEDYERFENTAEKLLKEGLMKVL